MLYNEDCIKGSDNILDSSVNLMICDPPFGIQEKSFDKYYNRQNKVISGYQEAPEDYYQFSYDWISKANQKLVPNGSMYIISGWTNSDIIGSVLRNLNLYIINKIIWVFNFGVSTKKKFVTSHYEIFYIKKKKNSEITFNTNCRYGDQEKKDNKSLLYDDLRSVWTINKEYSHNKTKNQNKLPEALVKKMILYSSNRQDVVCDFFLGNFTTAIVSKKMGRIPAGFEINENSYKMGMENLSRVKEDLISNIQNVVPLNQGKKISKENIVQICDYFVAHRSKKTKKEIIEKMMKTHKRGRFSISKIIDKYCDDSKNVKNKIRKADFVDMFEND